MVNSIVDSTSEDEEVEYEVERILAQENEDGRTLYLVKWLGYPDEQCTWESSESFLNPQTLADWRQQLALGDTLDEEEVAVLQDRMDAYGKAQQENRLRHEELVGTGMILDIEEKSPSPTGDTEEAALLSPRGLPDAIPDDLVSQPEHTLPGPQNLRETDSRTPTVKQPGTGSASSNNVKMSATLSTSDRQEVNIATQASAKASSDNAARRTPHRVGERFKNLRHQNNYVKRAHRERTPDMSKIARRAPEEWMVRRGSQTGENAGNAAPPSEDGESWLFVPAERQREDDAEEAALLSPKGPPDAIPDDLVSQHHDSNASPRTSAPLTDADLRTPQMPHSTDMVVARNGRTWRRGDIAVHLLFGDHAVGDVKILHLPPWLRVKILALKPPSEQTLNIHFLERNVISVNAYSALAPKFGRTSPALAAIESYEDTIKATDSLAEHLEVNNVAAVWEYPAQTENLIAILYSCRAAGWHHLGRKTVTMFEARLHLSFQNVFNGFRLEYDSTENAGTSQPPKTISDIVTSRRKGPDAQRPIDAVPLGVYHGATDPDATLGLPNKPAIIPHQKPTKATLVSSPPPEISFSINVENLLQVQDGCTSKQAVYVAFVASHPMLANAVKMWLSDQINPRQVYTDAEKDGWAKWCEGIDTNSGCILFHDERPLYADLKYFSRCLASPAGITCYNMSFERRATGTYHCSFSRLFPRGSAIFITERSMLKYPEVALHAMRWFEKSSTGKVESWKMCLIPNAVEWILDRAQDCDSKDQESYIGLVHMIHKLQMQMNICNAQRREGDPELLVTGTSRYEQEGFLLPLPNLPTYLSLGATGDSKLTEDAVNARDSLLLEYFTGWAATKAAQYRKFLVLDDRHTNKTQKHSWHVRFCDPIKFKHEMKY